jgi:ABC-type transporter Mla subunit MlaD
MNHDTIELAFVVLGAVALATQTAILLAVFIGVTKAAKSVKNEIDEMKTAVMPVVASAREMIETTRGVVNRLTPKVEATVTDLSEVAHSLRTQAEDVQVSMEQLLERVRNQSGRIDTMFSRTLDSVDKASTFVATKVSKPMKQISGLLAGLKAVVESLRSSDPAYREPTLHDDKDMFV